MCITEDTEAEVIGVWNVYMVVTAEKTHVIYTPLSIGGSWKVIGGDRVIGECRQDVFMELLYIH
jgi:hypothetical protein